MLVCLYSVHQCGFALMQQLEVTSMTAARCTSPVLSARKPSIFLDAYSQLTTERYCACYVIQSILA